MFNEAIEDGIIRKEQYPFGRRKYVIPASRNVKKALTLSEIERIFNYTCQDGSAEQKARDLWVFSYLFNGANIKDIAMLKYQKYAERSDRVYQSENQEYNQA